MCPFCLFALPIGAGRLSRFRSFFNRPDKLCHPNRVMGGRESSSVGTRGPCACPCWSATIMPHGTQANRIATRTSTRPPHPLHPAPCPYRTGPRTLLHSVGKIHQDGAVRIAAFGCQISSGQGRAFLMIPDSIVKIHQDGYIHITVFDRSNSSGWQDTASNTCDFA